MMDFRNIMLTSFQYLLIKKAKTSHHIICQLEVYLDFADLFIYREHKPSKKGIVHYPRVDWFDHYVEKAQQKTEDEKE